MVILYACLHVNRAVYPERNDSSIMTLSILMRWVVSQTNRMIPSMTRYAATTRSRRCPRESEPLACLKFESKQRVIFPLATVAMAYYRSMPNISCYYKCGLSALPAKLCHRFYIFSREIAHWLQFGVITIFLRAFIAILKK